MLNLFAEALMIATRVDPRPHLRDARKTDDRARADLHFWRGRTWRPFDPKDL